MKTDKIVDFGEVLKKAWQHVRKYKYLWLLGLLAGSGSGVSSNNFSWVMDSSSSPSNWRPESIYNLPSSIPSMGRVLGAADSTVSSVSVLIITLITLMLFVVVIYLNITARGAIISAVDKINQEKENTLSDSWKNGHKYFWRILGFSIIFALLIIVPLLFLATPVVIMVVVRWYIPAVIIGIVFLLLFIVYAIYLSLSVQYGERILVLENEGAWDSIKAGTQFLHKNWKNVLLAYLILLAVMFGAVAILAIGIILVVGTLFGIVYGVYLLNSVVAIILAIPLGLALLVAFLTASGVVSSYRSTFITLVYSEIKSND